MFCTRVQCCALVLAAFVGVSAHARQQPTAEVQAVQVVPGDAGPVVEIFATRPLTPQLQTVEGPLRLVIDLPNSTLNTVHKKVSFRNQQIKGVRMDQYQAATTRVVVDLAAQVRYSWDATGNRLNIRIRTDGAAAATPATVPALTPAPQPVAVPYSEGGSGTLVEAGSRVGSGSSITAKETTAVLRLTRGGEVRVCPGTTISVATSSDGKDLMLGMNMGSIETHYHLQESSDSVLTPDFRIVLPGPGEFNLAVKSDTRGDTCVSSLPGSTSSVVVAELLGNGSYEVKPLQQVLFRQGRMQSVETPLAPCGCLPPPEPVLRASADPSSVVPEAQAGTRLNLSNANDQPSTTAGHGATRPADSANQKTADPVAPAGTFTETDENKAQVSTPLVFSAKELAKIKAAQKKPIVDATKLPLSTRQADPPPAMVVLPPAAEAKPAHKGFFRRLGGFFKSMF